MTATKTTVLVTGASGYLASWVVKQLLEEGHRVHATVRDLAKTDKVSHLATLQNAFPERLVLFEADLMRAGSFDNAIEGCTVVIHTASPYFLDKPKNIQAELLQPAIDGTLNVLSSVESTPSVQRVILTSSIVALFNDAIDVVKYQQGVVGEQSHNQNTDSHYNSYAYSKTLAEKAAWDKQAAQTRWSLITIHPGAIFGPALSNRKDFTSGTMMTQFLNGSFSSGVPELYLGVVDVRDVAKIHVAAAMNPKASGRYIAVAETLSLLSIAQKISTIPEVQKRKLPTRVLPKTLIWCLAPLIKLQRRYVANNVGFPIEFDTKRTQTDLGVEFESTETTLRDHVQQVQATAKVLHE